MSEIVLSDINAAILTYVRAFFIHFNLLFHELRDRVVFLGYLQPWLFIATI